MNDAARAESGRAVNHRGAGEAFGAQTLEERAGQRQVMKPIGLAEEDPDEELRTVQYAHRSSFSVPRADARRALAKQPVRLTMSVP